MKIDRLLGILTVLLQNDSMTAPELARKFEVNRRTIGRDIDALCQAGIPVITRQGAKGGISIAEGYKLDKSILTRDELSDITAALKGIGSVSEKPVVLRILDKLNAGSGSLVSMREPVIIDLASHYKDRLSGKIELIKQAVLKSYLIEFDYFYEKGRSHRRMEPYFVVFQWSSWYVFGFCLERQDWRMFKLLRICNMAVIEYGFTPREIPEDRRDFNSHFSDDIKLRAVFDESAKFQLIETYGLDCYIETDEGLIFEKGFTNKSFVIQWLLSFGSKVKVLEPEDIAEALKLEAKNIMERYK